MFRLSDTCQIPVCITNTRRNQEHQVAPFHLRTPDGNLIYAWHILPLPLYQKHQANIAQGASSDKAPLDVAATESFRLLRSDPEAKLILYFHGNAGHVAQMYRADSYHSLTDTSSYHVIAIDYRGYGHSTGYPTEPGLIQDAETLVEWSTKVAGVSSDRIVLFGHSLGTAVVSGVADKYSRQGVDFAGLVLVAGFSDLSNLLTGYRIGGVFPVMGPLAAWPSVVRFLQGFVVDKWHSANRLASIVRHSEKRLRLELIHSYWDLDIPWEHEEILFQAAANATTNGLTQQEFDRFKKDKTQFSSGGAGFVAAVKAKPDIVIRQELVMNGGHSDIVSSSAVIMAVMRCFEQAD
ncbi:hypothetical protein UVI_02017790 [Ustilaginoidea virens]|uniref:AB hydrolase-1 domain-containing protein n=1 Tax=Ustilaginoidea virens TaxID=1159556 RepID=A0A1B5KS50_USTVR|nr:hypothetical protein UVI_02017790 [Ustilaginoidea virens]